MLLNRPWKKILILVLGIFLFLELIFFLLPYKELRKFKKSSYSITIKDTNNIPLYVTSLDHGLKRERVFEKDIPNYIKNIILKSEDRFYYFHLGVNPFSILRTIYYNLKEDRVISGASTIPMQLARIITPRDKSIKSKILEMIDANRLVLKLGKSETLSLYLSHIPFGKNMEGYQSAAKRHYGKNLKELDIPEISILSIIPRSPSLYDPIDNRSIMEEALYRQNKNLDIKLYNKGFVLIKSRESKVLNPIEAPHFVNFVLGGLTKKDYQSGLDIITTLDLNINRDAQKLLNLYIESSSENRVSNGSLLLIHQGNIIGYIGSGDFYDKENQGQIDGIHIQRQPGSTLKPFLYELAFEFGFTPASILPDIPLVFGKTEAYRPENYSQTYNGPVDIRTALASSLNIPAVYMLERLGVDHFIERLKLLGFDSLIGQEDSSGLGLAVGNAEVSLYELVRAFRVFKNNGQYQKLNWIEGRTTLKTKVMDSTNASIIVDILRDKKARVLGFGRNSVLNTDYPAYFKTGTSNQFTNIWALGATKDLTCGVWMGNFSGDTVIGTPGSSIPARVVERLLDELSNKESFDKILGVEKVDICALSGELFSANCTTKKSEYFKDPSKLKSCSYHKPDGSIELPPEYSEWLSIYSYDNYRTSQTSSFFDVMLPQDGAEFYYTPEFPDESQGVEFQLVGKGAFSILGNENLILQGELPFQGIVHLQRGPWYIVVKSENRSIERYITIN